MKFLPLGKAHIKYRVYGLDATEKEYNILRPQLNHAAATRNVIQMMLPPSLADDCSAGDCILKVPEFPEADGFFNHATYLVFHIYGVLTTPEYEEDFYDVVIGKCNLAL